MATINGSSGNDILNGTNDDDTITNGGGGGDTINGNGGNDRIVLTGNLSGLTSVDGGTGWDTLVVLPDDGRDLTVDIPSGGIGDGQSGGQFFTNIEGFETGDGDDTFIGTSGSHYMSSGAGNDTLTTNGGSDTIDAGSGDDLVTVNGNFNGASTTIEGGTGNDTIVLDSNEDYDLFFDMNTGVLGDGVAGTDTITGFENVTTDIGNDNVIGTSGANEINTYAGNDTVTAGDGNDTVRGASGDDSIDGGAGDDLLIGGHDVTTGELFTNGDFATGDLTGWTSTGQVRMDGERPNMGATTISDTSDGALSQTINTLPGETYDLTLDAFWRGASTNSGSNNTFEILVDGVVIFTDTSNGTINTSGLSFVATGDTTEIEFRYTDNDSNGSNGGLTIDNVSVMQNAIQDDDTIDGGDGADTIYGNDGADSLIGGAGADSIFGGDGADTIDGGTGADSIFGGEGSDTIQLNDGFGDDTIVGGEDTGDTDTDVLDASGLTEGIDVVYGANPEDGTLTGRTSGDVATFSEIENIVYIDQDDTADASVATAAVNISTGGGADTITTGAYGDTVDAGDGDDEITIGGSLTETGQITSVDGGAGTDTLILDPTDDRDLTVDMSAGTVADGVGGAEVFSNIENVTTADGDDTVTGDSNANVITTNDGSDAIDAGGGDDTVLAGAGDDSVDGGAGDDSIDGGAGNDTLTGGLGNDTFVVSGGNDVITDFNSGNTGSIDDGNTNNNDFIDLSSYYDNIWELRADHEDDGILNQSNQGTTFAGQTIDYSDNDALPGTITLTGVEKTELTFDNTGVVCFAEGTLIETPKGAVPVESLAKGDLVQTLDHGAQPIKWCSYTSHSWQQGSHSDKPIEIKADAFGPGLPARTLRVSPQHKLLACTPSHPDGVLVPAKALIKFPGVREMKGCRSVNYYHIMLDQHHVLISDGVPTESFYPGPMALKSLNAENRTEVKRILAQATNGKGLNGYPHARTVMRVREAAKLLKENNRAIFRAASEAQKAADFVLAAAGQSKAAGAA